MTQGSRRQLVQAGAALAAVAAIRALGPRRGWPASPPADLPERNDLSHLLSRISFGIVPDELETARRLGYEEYLERQLDWQSIDASELEDGLRRLLPTLSMSLPDSSTHSLSGSHTATSRRATARC